MRSLYLTFPHFDKSKTNISLNTTRKIFFIFFLIYISFDVNEKCYTSEFKLDERIIFNRESKVLMSVKIM